MKQRLLHSLIVSLEWRVVAFVITNMYLWFITKEFWTATLQAFALQGILLATHFVWYFLREEKLQASKRA